MSPTTDFVEQQQEEKLRREQDRQVANADEIALTAISSLIIAAFFAALGESMETILIILVVILVTAVGLGWIENTQRGRK